MAAPITVHRLAPAGGRRVTAHTTGRVQVLGVAHSDRDVLEFVRRASLEDDDQALLDDPAWVRWTGDEPHAWGSNDW
ncbi:hypothetical protein [Streptomyces sp. NPDC048644]|uniref:hypothetical protein n=1 Tax=Streptomyces sp. NPDC048644 TaxID=3365582 RepID=UPI003712B8F7